MPPEPLDPFIDPPSALRVAERALALCAVVARAYLDEGGGDAHTEPLRAQLGTWLAELGVSHALLPRERSALERPTGRLAPREQVDASWLCEGLAVLGFSLGRLDLPAPDDALSPRRVGEAFHFLDPRAQGLLASPALRPPEELALAEARLHLAWDRLRAFEQTGAAVDLNALAAGTELGRWVLEGVPLHGGDLRMGDRALGDAEPARVAEARAAAAERVRAMQWILGKGPVYGLAG